MTGPGNSPSTESRATTASPARRCLFIYPQFRSESFWNYRATCELVGAKYPAAPLGLITVAALLPESWEVRLVDRNVETLEQADIDWAELVFIGGMIAQQSATLELLAECKAAGKTVIVGGPDATSSPHLYAPADSLVLGEAEVTLPRWLADFEAGSAKHSYECGEEKADVTTSPRPRFDLLDFDRYLHVGVQFARGCPFMCEFCDIIELFGRVPRLKGVEQMLGELQYLYDLGYRGHVDFVDDNFIGNKRDVKKFLVEFESWLEQHEVALRVLDRSFGQSRRRRQAAGDDAARRLLGDLRRHRESRRGDARAHPEAAEHQALARREHAQDLLLRHLREHRLHRRLRHRAGQASPRACSI